MKKVHRFTTSVDMGVIGETLLYSLLTSNGDEVTDVRKEKEWQSRGVDFIWEGLKIDAKFDTQTSKTSNIALETISVKKNGEVVKPGWVYDSESDIIIYIYLWGEKWKLVIFTPEEARDMLLPEYRRVEIWNTNYTGEVVLVPEDRFSRYCEIPLAGQSEVGEFLDTVRVAI